MRNRYKHAIDLTTLFLGSFLVGVAVVLFYKAGHIPTGGAPGVSLLIHYFIDISPGILILFTNIPFLIWGYFLYGKRFVGKTASAVILTSAWVDIIYYLWPTDKMITHNLMLMTIFGGIIVGTGIGLMFKSGGSPSGWGVLIKVLSKKTGMPVGKTLIFLDLSIILTSAIVYQNVESAMFGTISTLIAGKTIDMILTGKPNSKAVHISCDNAEQLLPFIKHKLLSPGSIINCGKADGSGFRDIILVTVQPKYIPQLVEVLEVHDPNAYMLVFDTTELYLTESLKST